MPLMEYHSFNDVVCIDLAENKVMKSGILNLKLSIFDESEINVLTPDYKNLISNNILSEFEYIFDCPSSIKNHALIAGRTYAFKIFEQSKIIMTEFKGLVLKLERTHKLEGNNQKYFYTGVKTDTVIDDLNIFTGFTPKTYIISNTINNKLIITTVRTKKEEQEMILNQNYQSCQFYHLEKYLDVTNNAPVIMIPQNISHLI